MQEKVIKIIDFYYIDFLYKMWYDYCMAEKRKKDYKKQFQMAEVERQHMKRAQKQAEISAAYDDDCSGPDRGWDGATKEELASEWEQLRRHAKTHFPEGADFVEITAAQKLAAIASVLGWSAQKISKASGVHIRTVHRWLSPKERPDVVYFADQFRIKTGKQDISELQNENMYKFMRFVNDVLSSTEDDVAKQRLKFDVGKWNYEAVKGKPGQTLKHEGLDLKSVYEAIAAIDVTKIGADEASDLFEDDEKTLN